MAEKNASQALVVESKNDLQKDGTELFAEQMGVTPNARSGVLAEAVIAQDKRLLQNIQYGTIRYVVNFTTAGIGTPVYAEYTLGSDGEGDSAPTTTGIPVLSQVHTTFLTEGFPHDTYPFMVKAIGVVPASLAMVGATAADVVTAGTCTTATGAYPCAGTAGVPQGSLNYNVSAEYADLMFCSFMQSYSAYLQLQGESCTLEIGNLVTLPGGAGPKGGAFVSNAEPLAEAFRYLPYYVLFPAGGRRNRPMTIVFEQDEVNKIVIDPNLIASTATTLYMDFKVLLYGRLCVENCDK